MNLSVPPQTTQDPGKIFALIVGISHYPEGGNLLPSVASPDEDALLFCRHLLEDRQIPKANIKLFLSQPLPYADEALPDHIEIPTSKAVTDWLTKDLLQGTWAGDMLLVYWAGHGICEIGRDRHLFFTDARPSTLTYNLKLDGNQGLLAYLRANTQVRFRRQILFVEACAAYIDSYANLAGELPPIVSSRNPKAVSQYVLMAAQSGDNAAFDTFNATGRFTHELMRLLDNQEEYGNDRLWEKMDSLGKRLDTTFQEWRTRDPLVQLPYRFVCEGLPSLALDTGYVLPPRQFTPSELQDELYQLGSASDVQDFADNVYKNWCGTKPTFFLLCTSDQDYSDTFVARLITHHLQDLEKKSNILKLDASASLLSASTICTLTASEWDQTSAGRQEKQRHTLRKALAPNLRIPQMAEARNSLKATYCPAWGAIALKIERKDWRGKYGRLRQTLQDLYDVCQEFIQVNNTSLIVFVIIEDEQNSRCACHVPLHRKLSRWLFRNHAIRGLKQAGATYYPMKQPAMLKKDKTQEYLQSVLGNYYVGSPAFIKFRDDTFRTCNPQRMLPILLALEQSYGAWRQMNASGAGKG